MPPPCWAHPLNQGLCAPDSYREKDDCVMGPVDQSEEAVHQMSLPSLWLLASVSNAITGWVFLSLGCMWPSSKAELKCLWGYNLATQVPIPKVGRVKWSVLGPEATHLGSRPAPIFALSHSGEAGFSCFLGPQDSQVIRGTYLSFGLFLPIPSIGPRIELQFAFLSFRRPL